MKIKQTFTRSIVSLALMVGFAGSLAFTPSVVKAGTTCGEIPTSIISCGGKKNADNLQDNGIWNLLLVALNIMTGLVGIAAIGGLIYGSILYASAQDNDSQVKKAKDTIGNVVIGIVAFALMYSFLQFIIPGGVFN